MVEDFERCYRAVRSRDTRFDGWFFTAVTSTGIYCRPSCPALAPRRENVRFYPTAAAAQDAGFRACKRCRPSASPGSPEWSYRDDAVARAMRLIADGTIDREGLSGLAGRLGYSRRQVERILVEGTGAGPVALARAQRAQSARALIEDTSLAFADVAFAAGFSSVRQFNDTVRAVFDTTPGALRARALSSGRRSGPQVPGVGTRPGAATAQAVRLRLAYREPFRADNLFGHLAATAVPGVEEVRGTSYRRTLRLPHGAAIVSLEPAQGHIAAEVVLADMRDLGVAVARCRRLLDLDADPVAVGEVLGSDPHLAALVAEAPGRRVPGCADAEEMAVRAVLGQQVSTAAARALGGRLAAIAGPAAEDPKGVLSRMFPTTAELMEAFVADPGAHLAMPASRAAAVRAVVAKLANGDLDLGPGADWQAARRTLASIAGVGPWTVEIVAMRGLGDPDALPLGDGGLERGAASIGLPASRAALAIRARQWRPWRSYATQYLWATLDHPINRFPVPAGPERPSSPPRTTTP